MATFFVSSFQQRTIGYFSLSCHELQLLSHKGKPSPLHFLDDSGRALYIIFHLNIFTDNQIHFNL